MGGILQFEGPEGIAGKVESPAAETIGGVVLTREVSETIPEPMSHAEVRFMGPNSSTVIEDLCEFMGNEDLSIRSLDAEVFTAQHTGGEVFDARVNIGVTDSFDSDKLEAFADEYGLMVSVDYQ